MSEASENGIDNGNLIGRESQVVPGRFGEPLQVTHVQYSRGGGNAAPRRPLILCLHGWGSNEADLADMMRYVAPYNDFASLRAPLVLQEAGSGEFGFGQGAYSWFHDCVPSGKDLDRDAYAAAQAIDDWVARNVPEDRAIVPIGFSQGGLLAIHLLRVHPERYTASISLSGFLAPGNRHRQCSCRQSYCGIEHSRVLRLRQERYRDSDAGAFRNRRLAGRTYIPYVEKLSWTRSCGQSQRIQRFARLACHARYRAGNPVRNPAEESRRKILQKNPMQRILRTKHTAIVTARYKPRYSDTALD